jgi:ATP-binding cassette subfamily F protein 3
MLGLATFGGPNLVILDEPTNHLDIDSRAALIEAINDYKGAVILVSHDRYLLEACVERLWLVADGQVSPFDGDLDEYQRRVLSDRRGNGKANNKTGDKTNDKTSSGSQEARRAPALTRGELAALRKRITQAEAATKTLSADIARLDAALADPGLFASDPAKGASLSKARAEAGEKLAQAEQDWLEAAGALEDASA